jgi:hypothetical protein
MYETHHQFRCSIKALLRLFEGSFKARLRLV